VGGERNLQGTRRGRLHRPWRAITQPVTDGWATDGWATIRPELRFGARQAAKACRMPFAQSLQRGRQLIPNLIYRVLDQILDQYQLVQHGVSPPARGLTEYAALPPWGRSSAFRRAVVPPSRPANAAARASDFPLLFCMFEAEAGRRLHRLISSFADRYRECV
jgi:hypothetical protein